MADEILTPEQVQKRRACAAFVEPPEAVTELCESHEALRAQLTAMERERDEWRALTISPRGAQYYIDKAAQAEAERDRLAQENERLREAIHNKAASKREQAARLSQDAESEWFRDTCANLRQQADELDSIAALAEAPIPDPTICPACKHPAHAAWECTAAVTIGNSDTGTTGGCACGYRPPPAREPVECACHPVNGEHQRGCPLRHIANEHGDCVSWCRACRLEPTPAREDQP